MVRNRLLRSDFEQSIDLVEIFFCSLIFGTGFALAMARVYIPVNRNKKTMKVRVKHEKEL